MRDPTKVNHGRNSMFTSPLLCFQNYVKSKGIQTGSRRSVTSLRNTLSVGMAFISTIQHSLIYLRCRAVKFSEDMKQWIDKHYSVGAC